jgi:profilin
MSWQAYVDTNLVGTGKLTQAAIHGHNGALWATSAGFSVFFFTKLKINATEMAALTKAFSDPSGIRANGLHVAEVKYIALRADDRSVYGKKVCIKKLISGIRRCSLREN